MGNYFTYKIIKNPTIQINQNAIYCSTREQDVAAYNVITIKTLNDESINNLKKILTPLKIVNNNELEKIINVLNYYSINKKDESQINFYLFFKNYVPLIKIIIKDNKKQNNKYCYKICYLEML